MDIAQLERRPTAMSFIQSDERILILDYNSYAGCELNADELSSLGDAGVKTVACYLRWCRVEKEKGVYDWSSMDAEVERIRKAGLKVIIKAYFSAPPFFPDAWYIRGKHGDIQRNIGAANPDGDHFSSSLSYWNPEAWNYHLEFIKRVCERYCSEHVLCINIAPANGEALIPGNNYLYDDYALASYRAFTGTDEVPGEALPGTPTLEWLRETVIPAQVETQRIFHHYGGEYWTMLHHAFETIPSTGNWLIDDLYRALHRELGDEHWGICYTLFRPGETRGLWGAEQDINRHGIKMLFASEGPMGLLTNTRRSIEMGARGMLTGPLAPYLGYTRMQSWMFEAIKNTLKNWVTQ
jgi:hypothetical protein